MWLYVLSFLELYLGVESLGCVINNSMLTFGGKLLNCLPKWLHHFKFLPTVREGLNLSTSSQALVIAFFFFFILYVLSGISLILDLPSPKDCDVEHLFMDLLATCVYSLVNYVLKFFAHF